MENEHNNSRENCINLASPQAHSKMKIFRNQVEFMCYAEKIYIYMVFKSVIITDLTPFFAFLYLKLKADKNRLNDRKNDGLIEMNNKVIKKTIYMNYILVSNIRTQKYKKERGINGKEK